MDVLRFLISLIDKKELQLPPGDMTEVEEIGVLRKELKNKEESREMFLKAGRQDLVDQLDYEIVVVKEYLPAEISEEKITEIVVQAIANNGNNFGLIMKEVMTKTGGSVDGGVISKIVKEKING
ncbi:MAG: GatB/YqeY domain-containing protein [Candidatus Shapirobacteria bacterium]|nr:GatB/YqeY domain-containing protein [Candidatus Shapirobacteria bacterium]